MIMGDGQHVLVVDDEETVRHLLVEQLKPRHFVVLTVADGLQALRVLHEGHVDAVITDLHLPYLDGLDLLRQCHLAWPQLPVILMSGSLTDDIIELAMNQGAYACLPKPVNTRKLIGVLRETIMRPVSPVETTRMTGSL